jgi:hypothetical protein
MNSPSLILFTTLVFGSGLGLRTGFARYMTHVVLEVLC